MNPNPLLGVVLHWIGGLAAASFYIPYRGVRRWAWESYWLAGGFFAWIVAPWAICLLLVPDPLDILRAAPRDALMWAVIFGLLWGVGGITYGLTLRYLGVGLGIAIALGSCALFGTLLPPIFHGTMADVARTRGGQVVLLGILACAAGIVLSGMAGVSKERELSPQQRAKIAEAYNLPRGIATALLCGMMSACFAFGLDAGKPIAELTRARLLDVGRGVLWQNLPVLVVVLIGGFTTNAVWCLALNIRNRTLGDYVGRSTPRAPILANYLLCALAGVTWYMQFFFYSMAQTKMGPFEFSSWTLHMASIILFGTLWGLALREWRGTGRRTRSLLSAGLIVLLVAMIIVGYGNRLQAAGVDADRVPSQRAAYVWTPVQPAAPFAPRDGAGALTFDHRMFLIGGWRSHGNGIFPLDCANDVWSSADGKTWRQERPNSFLDARSFDASKEWEGRHTAGYVVHDGKMWIVGGDAIQKHYQSDVWNSTDGKNWTHVNAGKPLPWGPRVLHHTVAHDGWIWVIGGQTLPPYVPGEERFCRDVWRSKDGINWEEIKPQEPFWPQRGMIGGSAVMNGRIWLLGGGTYDTPNAPNRKYYNDVWSSADGVHWTQHVEHAPWAPRQYHDVAVFDGKLWVMEGYAGANRNDVWYSSDGVNWYELANTPWKPRHAASVFVHDDSLWMVTGNNMESDVWRLSRGKVPAGAAPVVE